MDSNTGNLRLKPEIGSLYHVDMLETKKVEKSINGRVDSNATNFSTTLSYDYSFDSLRADNAYETTILFSFLKQKSVFKADSSMSNQLNAPDHPLQQAFLAFEGASFRLAIAASGKTIDIKDYDTFKEKMDSLYSKATVNHPNKLPLFFSQYYLLGVFDRFSANLPDTAISIGSTWAIDLPPTIGEANTWHAEYHLTSLLHDTAYVKTRFSVKDTVRLQNGKTTQHSEGEGHLELEVHTGLPLKSEYTIRTISDLAPGGPDFKTIVTYKFELKATRKN